MSRYWRRSRNNDLEKIITLLILWFILSIFSQDKSVVVKAWTSFFLAIAVLITLLMLKLLFQRLRDMRLSSSGIYDIDKMTGSEFENRLMVLYKNLGYSVEHIGRTGDFGVDLIVSRYGKRTAIQAKRYQGNVGEDAVQQVHTGKDFYHCDEAIIVTNSFFTPMARKVADATHIKLWNRNYLIKVLLTEHDRLTNNSTNVTNQQSTIVSHPESVSKPKPKATKELVQYIGYCIRKGEKWTDLQSRLIKVGWQEEMVNDAFFHVYNATGLSNITES
jgi:restriction system protein